MKYAWISAICLVCATSCSNEQAENGEGAEFIIVPQAAPQVRLPRSDVEIAIEQERREKTIFQCYLRNQQKPVGVLASEKGGAVFEFGWVDDAPEFVLSGGEWASATDSGGSVEQIKFEDGEKSYVIVSYFADPPWHTKFAKSTVFGLQNGKFVWSDMCSVGDEWWIDKDKAEKALARSETLFLENLRLR